MSVAAEPATRSCSIDEDADSRAMVRAIIALAKSLRITVIAEGVETKSQLEFLQAEGCDRAEGYYFCKPVSSEEFLKLLPKDGPLIRSETEE